MLNHVKIKFAALFLIVSCCDMKRSDSLEVHPLKNYRVLIKEEIYKIVYKKFCDTLSIWAKFEIFGSKDSIYSINYADSLLCFNSDKTRMVTCVLNKYVNKNQQSKADGINFFYGEKIEGQWYFFKGPYVHIPREMIENHPVNKPLSYQQLHQIALKEVYSGYLKSDGSINEQWFTGHFEGPGWVNWDDTPEKIAKYKRKDYEQFHLRKVKNNWNGYKNDSINVLP